MSDLTTLVQTLGYFGLLFIIFAESGLFLGFFLPGDSLLFTAGLLASSGHLNILFVIVVSFMGAVIGDSFGYYFGTKIGHRIFSKEDSFLFSKNHIKRAERFYKKHGAKTIVLARFMPIIRTFAPILAGVAQMDYSIFIFYNVIGGVTWGIGIPLAGYFLGNAIPNVDHYIIPILAIIIVLSSIPAIVEFLRNKKYRRSVTGMFKRP